MSSEAESGLWYAHQVGYPYIPAMIDGRSTFGTKDYAMMNAAIMSGCTTLQEYKEIRRQAKNTGTYEHYRPDTRWTRKEKRAK